MLSVLLVVIWRVVVQCSLAEDVAKSGRQPWLPRACVPAWTLDACWPLVQLVLMKGAVTTFRGRLDSLSQGSAR
jgi:hypothetical protein